MCDTSGDFTKAVDTRSIRALLFGAMLDRAQSVVELYRSDLFHDALWIEKYVAEERRSIGWSAVTAPTSVLTWVPPTAPSGATEQTSRTR